MSRTALGLGLALTRRGGTAGPSVAAQLATLLGPTASFWLPGPAYFFTDAGKTTPCADTDPIQVWADASANGRDLSQATLAARPLARLIGGKWRARADGTDDFMSRAFTGTGTAHSLGVAASLSADGNFPMAMVLRSAVYELRTNGASRIPEITTDNGGGTATAAAAVPLNTPTRLVGAYAGGGAASTLYRDGVQVAQDAADTMSFSPDTLHLGARPGPGFFWPGDFFAAVLVPGTTLSAGTVASLDAILATLV